MLYDDVLRALNDPAFVLDVRSADLAGLSDEDLGGLLPAAYRSRPGATEAMARTRVAVHGAARDRAPRYTPEACRRMVEAVAACVEDPDDVVSLRPVADALAHCTGPWPELSGPARALTAFLVRRGDVSHPYTLLVLAGLADHATLRATADLLGRDQGAIARDGVDTALSLSQAEQALLVQVDGVNSYEPPPDAPDLWCKVAGIPAFVAFARRALEAAADRADAIGRGDLPYRADKAFAAREVEMLGQAARVALLRDEPWLPGVLDRLLPGVAVAPTAAKSVPSQALLYELGRAARDFPTPEAVAALRTARSVTRHAAVPKQLDKLLKKVEAALAERTEVALRLPRAGFDDGGVLRREAGGGCTAVVTVAETAELTWEKDGRPLKSVPASVRRDQAGLVKELRDLVKRVGVQLGTLARALEGGFTVDTVQPYARWRAELADHPLARAVVRRLIWEIEGPPGQWRSFLPVIEDLPEAPDDASVRLWHPIRADAGTVGAWRDRIVDGRIRQPFKQAFREIYRLTPAEEETGDHSFRFAAHLVHYQRMAALFRARGWRSRLLGPWDCGDGDAALRTLGAGEWRVAFAHTYVDGADGGGVASTDRVSFEHRVDGTWRQAPLAAVPPLVFSEAMRDVDLFVGVTSIAADPDWTEQGPARAYWERAGFAELPESAEARRDALARILPRLKIADRCTLDGRFLVVRGDLGTYRIHLGSANILMEPDDSYLCVVPSRAAVGGKVFLPFEDDRLTVILSKALLLAADTSITDPTILRQIRRGQT
ncbi:MULTISPECIES: DUF4132 domain-containing protein [unclassified Streptomyces]|uniref:DUF4132 domain-containing protein n=1 Tax=unclassified Streptomyces TaxID=2593676 RepID=UPI0036E224DA